MRNNKRRFIYMILLGLGIATLINQMMPKSVDDHNPMHDYVLSLFITFLIWEGNLMIDHRLNQKLPWLKRPALRLFVQFVVALVYSSLALLLPMKLYNVFICVIPPDREVFLNKISLIMGLIVSVIILTIEVSTQFFRNWRASLLEVERYKTETVKAQLQSLKSQVNPHFLFNNLSVLTSLVYKDQDKAADFINQLSKVYRYLLDSQDKELVKLETELEFIRSYVFLLQIRFDKNLIFDWQVPDRALTLYLPPLALQYLVENVIKHNEVSDEHHLKIELSAEGEKLIIKNNLQRRSHIEGTSGTGLRNIRQRYLYFTEKEVEVLETHEHFIVKLPLLEKK
ncbi:MAG: histidine kinase [Bacteroidia bacterium]|nr:histidine kinase [Bacteroidia bacterium]